MEAVWIFKGWSAMMRKKQFGVFLGTLLLTMAATVSASQYNVLDYGARNNGFTDCTSAIQKTVDAAYAGGGGTVYFPRGSYVVKKTVQMKDGVSIAGSGMSVIKANLTGTGAVFDWAESSELILEAMNVQSSNANLVAFSVEDGEHITVQNCIVSGLSMLEVGNQPDSVCLYHNQADGLSGKCAPVTVLKAGKIEAEQNQWSNYQNLLQLGGTELIVRHNRFYDAGIGLANVSELIMEGNTFVEGCVSLDSVKNADIRTNHISSNTKTNLLISGKSQNLRIHANHFRTDTDQHQILQILDTTGTNSQIKLSANKFLMKIGEDGKTAGEGLATAFILGCKMLTLENNYWNNVCLKVEQNQPICQIQDNRFLVSNVAANVFTAFEVLAKKGSEGIRITNNEIVNAKQAVQVVENTGMRLSAEGGAGELLASGNTLTRWNTDLFMDTQSHSEVQKPIYQIRENYFNDGTVSCSDTTSGNARLYMEGNQAQRGMPLDLSGLELPIGNWYFNMTENFAGMYRAEHGWTYFLEIGEMPYRLKLMQDAKKLSAELVSEHLSKDEEIYLAVYDGENRLQSVSRKDMGILQQMRESFDSSLLAPAQIGSLFQVRWAQTPWCYDDASVDNISWVSANRFGRTTDADDMCICINNDLIYGDRFDFYPYRTRAELLNGGQILDNAQIDTEQTTVLEFDLAVEPETDANCYHDTAFVLNGGLISLNFAGSVWNNVIANGQTYGIYRELNSNGIAWRRIKVEMDFLSEDAGYLSCYLDGECLVSRIPFQSTGTGYPEVGGETFSNRTFWWLRVLNISRVESAGTIISSDRYYFDNFWVTTKKTSGITPVMKVDVELTGSEGGFVKAFAWNNKHGMQPLTDYRMIAIEE